MLDGRRMQTSLETQGHEPAGKDVRKVIGDNIRELRQKRGLSQEALAFEACLDQPYLSRMEQGTINLTVLVIERLARALDVSPYRLLIEKREATGMTQTEIADKLGEYQSFVARVESGQRRVDVIEFLDLAEILGLDPKKVIAELMK